MYNFKNVILNEKKIWQKFCEKKTYYAFSNQHERMLQAAKQVEIAA